MFREQVPGWEEDVAFGAAELFTGTRLPEIEPLVGSAVVVVSLMDLQRKIMIFFCHMIICRATSQKMIARKGTV